jgi:hypothetical protein
MANTVPFEKSEVKNYLRRCVLHWRVKDAEGDEVAKYYIDAFQSVSMSLFGETVPPNNACTGQVAGAGKSDGESTPSATCQ